MASASGPLELPAKSFILPSMASLRIRVAPIEKADAPAHSSRPRRKQHDNKKPGGPLRPYIHSRLEASLGVAERRPRGGLWGVRQIGGEIVGAFGRDAVERRFADHRPRVVPRAANDDRVAEPLRPPLVGREYVPDEIDRRPVLRQGGAEVAAHEIASGRRRGEGDLALSGGFIEAVVEASLQFGGSALDRNDRHGRAGHARVRPTRELLAAFDARSHISGGFDAAAGGERRQERQNTRRKRLARPDRAVAIETHPGILPAPRRIPASEDR